MNLFVWMFLPVLFVLAGEAAASSRRSSTASIVVRIVRPPYHL